MILAGRILFQRAARLVHEHLRQESGLELLGDDVIDECPIDQLDELLTRRRYWAELGRGSFDFVLRLACRLVHCCSVVASCLIDLRWIRSRVGTTLVI